ncbi:unnamed protein product [Prunus armeniaca]|uniref:Ubiquitin-like protease family profile domain-containing protein n=2 Tax=Prunus armeniaca TaxID=36596 RepID=A0A6J5USB4_PRUAR|nr:unnamed protein product [Prunus armeniaca]
MVIHRKTGYFNFLKTKGDEMKAQKIVEKVDMKTKKEIANMWQKLDATQKAEYESKTPSTNASNKSCLKIATRCSPKDIKDTINVLSDEKKEAIEEMGFVSLLEMKCRKLSHSMCVKDGGEEVDFTGSMDDQDIVKFNTKGCGNFGGHYCSYGRIALQYYVCVIIKNEEKERTLRTPCPHELEVKLKKEDDNMLDMGCDGGQKFLGNTKPPKSRPNKENGTPNEQDDNVKGFATVDKTSAPSIEVIRERKHAKQPQNEDKMGHNKVKNLFLENCSSTSTRDPIVTRATANRKPGPHKRTPYEDINELKAKANAKTRQVIAHEQIMKRLGVGPFRMTNDISEDDRDLLSLHFVAIHWIQNELLVDTGAVAIDHHHLRSLAPGSPLFDDIINVMADYLYDTTSTKWFLPTYFWSECAKFARPSDRMTSCARTHNFCLARFNGRLKDCMQIYIPMHEDVIGHWYLFICDIFHKKAEIWDSLPDARHNKKRENDCHISYDSNEQQMRLAIELVRNEKNLLCDAITREALKVMENGSDFMAKGNKIGNVEVKDMDVADVTVRRKRVYIRKQKKSAVTIPKTRTGRSQPRPRRH